MAQGDMHIFGSAIAKFLTGDIDANTDTLKAAMVDSGYTFAITDDFFDDVSGSELSGTNYTAGGTTLIVASHDPDLIARMDQRIALEARP